MKFFIDTAKVEDIRKANDMGIIIFSNHKVVLMVGFKLSMNRDFAVLLLNIIAIRIFRAVVYR